MLSLVPSGLVVSGIKSSQTDNDDNDDKNHQDITKVMTTVHMDHGPYHLY